LNLKASAFIAGGVEREVNLYA